jgi:hypothetical protein
VLACLSCAGCKLLFCTYSSKLEQLHTTLEFQESGATIQITCRIRLLGLQRRQPIHTGLQHAANAVRVPFPVPSPTAVVHRRFVLPPAMFYSFLRVGHREKEDMPCKGLFSRCVMLACLPSALCKLLLCRCKVDPRNAVREPHPSKELFASPDAHVHSIDWSTQRAPVLPFNPFTAYPAPSPLATPAHAAHFDFTTQHYFPNTNAVPLHPPSVEALLVESPASSFNVYSPSTQSFTTTSLVPSITTQPPTSALFNNSSAAMDVVKDTRLRMSDLTVVSKPAFSAFVASSDDLSITSLSSVDRPTKDFHPGCVGCGVLVGLSWCLQCLRPASTTRGRVMGQSLALCSSALLPLTAASGSAALAGCPAGTHVATILPVSLTVPPAPVSVTGLCLLSLLNSTRVASRVASRVATGIYSACSNMNTVHGLPKDAATTGPPLVSSPSTLVPVSSPPVVDSSRALDADGVSTVPLPLKVFTLQHASPAAKECGYAGPVVQPVHKWLAIIEDNARSALRAAHVLSVSLIFLFAQLYHHSQLSGCFRGYVSVCLLFTSLMKLAEELRRIACSPPYNAVHSHIVGATSGRFAMVMFRTPQEAHRFHVDLPQLITGQEVFHVLLLP